MKQYFYQGPIYKNGKFFKVTSTPLFTEAESLEQAQKNIQGRVMKLFSGPTTKQVGINLVAVKEVPMVQTNADKVRTIEEAINKLNTLTDELENSQVIIEPRKSRKKVKIEEDAD